MELARHGDAHLSSQNLVVETGGSEGPSQPGLYEIPTQQTNSIKARSQTILWEIIFRL